MNSKADKDWKWVDSYDSSSGVGIHQQWGNITDYTEEMVPGNMVIRSSDDFKILSSNGSVSCGYICELKTPSPNIGTAYIHSFSLFQN